jgi:predicted RNase H-like nuclease (RuvC/YqgF family)
VRCAATPTAAFKAESRQKDRELEDLRSKLQRAERQAGEASEQLAALREAAASKESEEESELEVLRSELDARKTMIKSLRADQERVTALQASLEEKRDVIEQLEASINRHSNTIAELRRSADTWKRKYQALKGDSPTATTSVNLPSLSDTDVRVIEAIEKSGVTKTEATIAIDMRRSLLEARRTAQGGGEK